MEKSDCCSCSDQSDPRRRCFLAQAGAILLGAVAYLTPLAAGLFAFLNPLRQKSAAGQSVYLTPLDTLGDKPKKFSVTADRTDAWNTFPAEPIGAVYLRRVGETVEALNVKCPHAGCAIQYQTADDKFFCPCHVANFDVQGKRTDAVSPSLRDMDTLEVDQDKLAEGQVWVKFQQFITGIAEKKPE